MALAKQRPNSAGIPRWNWLVGFITQSDWVFPVDFPTNSGIHRFFYFFFSGWSGNLTPWRSFCWIWVLLKVGVPENKYVDVGRCGKKPEDFEDLRPQAMTQWFTVVLSWKIGWKSVSSRLLHVKAEAETIEIRQKGLVLGFLGYPAIEFVRKIATQTATKKGLVLAVESHRSVVSQPRPRQCNMDDAPLSMRRQVACWKPAPLCWGMFRVGTCRW